MGRDPPPVLSSAKSGLHQPQTFVRYSGESVGILGVISRIMQLMDWLYPLFTTDVYHDAHVLRFDRTARPAARLDHDEDSPVLTTHRRGTRPVGAAGPGE